MTALRAATAWTAVVVVLCLIPGSGLPEIDAPVSTDKWVHVAMFVGVGGLWSLAHPRRPWAVLGLGSALGAAIEVAQHAMGWGRSGDPWDVVADVVGLALGVGLARAAAARERAP